MPLFQISPESIRQLRRGLQVEDGASVLHQAGFATGQALATEWRDQLRQRASLDDPALLDQRWFGPLLSELCERLGWGPVELESPGDEVLLISSTAWTESEPGSAEIPSCHFTAGALASFLTSQAGAPLAVLEVECRSCGGEACRFLAGAPDLVSLAWDLLAAGGNWRDALHSNEID